MKKKKGKEKRKKGTKGILIAGGEEGAYRRGQGSGNPGRFLHRDKRIISTDPIAVSQTRVFFFSFVELFPMLF